MGKHTTQPGAKQRTGAAHSTKKPAKHLRSTTQRRPRKLPVPRSRWFRPSTWSLTREYARQNRTPIPKARVLVRESLATLLAAHRALAGITLFYGISMIVFVRGFSAGFDIAAFRALLDEAFSGTSGQAQSTFYQLSKLFSTTGETSSATGSMYQTIFIIVCSLAVIWVLRMSQAQKPVSTKRSFYLGMYPIVPFFLVLLVVGLQLLPLSAGTYLYSLLTTTGIVVTGWEYLVTILVCGLLVFWSLRMVTSSLFALYIVTLPDMQPRQALRSAKQLVVGRRLLVWRKLLPLPILVVVITTVLILPVLFFWTAGTVWVFFALTVLWFPLIHVYLYTLYRKLIA